MKEGAAGHLFGGENSGRPTGNNVEKSAAEMVRILGANTFPFLWCRQDLHSKILARLNDGGTARLICFLLASAGTASKLQAMALCSP